MEQVGPRNVKKVCSRIGLALFLMMLLWQAGTVVLSALLKDFAPVFRQSEWSSLIINDVALYGLGVPVYLLILYFVPNGPVRTQRPPIKFGVGKFLLCLIFCFGITYLFNFVTNMMIILLQLLAGGALSGGNALGDVLLQSSPLAIFIFAVCVPAVGEEFLFRYMLRKKMNGCADKTYIFFSALCFALFHGNLAQGMYTFVVGVVLGWMYVVSHKLWLCMLMHFTFNLLGLLVVPAALNHMVLLMVVLLFVLITVPTAIVLFFVYKRYVLGTMLPPHEVGWPYKPPKPVVLNNQIHWPYYGVYLAQWAYGPGAVFQPWGAAQQGNRYPLYGQGSYRSVNLYQQLGEQYWEGMAWRSRLPGAAKLCVGNVGMILYIVLSVLLMVVMLIAMVAL